MVPPTHMRRTETTGTAEDPKQVIMTNADLSFYNYIQLKRQQPSFVNEDRTSEVRNDPISAGGGGGGWS